MSKSETKEDNAHPETITPMPDKPGSVNHKTHRALFDTCASASLIAPELLDKDLKGCVKNSTKKSTWKTGMCKFVSEGTVKISKAVFPSLATQ